MPSRTFTSSGHLRDLKTGAAIMMPPAVEAADVQDGVINFNTSGDHSLVAAPGTGFAVRLVAYVMTNPAGAALTWKSGSTAKSGPMTPATGISAPTPGPGGRQLQCAENQALVLNSDTAGQHGGHFIYQIVGV